MHLSERVRRVAPDRVVDHVRAPPAGLVDARSRTKSSLAVVDQHVRAGAPRDLELVGARPRSRSPAPRAPSRSGRPRALRPPAAACTSSVSPAPRPARARRAPHTRSDRPSAAPPPPRRRARPACAIGRAPRARRPLPRSPQARSATARDRRRNGRARRDRGTDLDHLAGDLAARHEGPAAASPGTRRAASGSPRSCSPRPGPRCEPRPERPADRMLPHREVQRNASIRSTTTARIQTFSSTTSARHERAAHFLAKPSSASRSRLACRREGPCPDGMRDVTDVSARHPARQRARLERRRRSPALALALLCAGLGLLAARQRRPSASQAALGRRDAAPSSPTAPADRIDGGAGATLWLLGTIHLGPAEGWTLSPEIEARRSRGADRRSFSSSISRRATRRRSADDALAERVGAAAGATSTIVGTSNQPRDGGSSSANDARRSNAMGMPRPRAVASSPGMSRSRMVQAHRLSGTRSLRARRAPSPADPSSRAGRTGAATARDGDRGAARVSSTRSPDGAAGRDAARDGRDASTRVDDKLHASSSALVRVCGARGDRAALEAIAYGRASTTVAGARGLLRRPARRAKRGVGSSSCAPLLERSPMRGLARVDSSPSARCISSGRRWACPRLFVAKRAIAVDRLSSDDRVRAQDARPFPSSPPRLTGDEAR